MSKSNLSAATPITREYSVPFAIVRKFYYYVFNFKAQTFEQQTFVATKNAPESIALIEFSRFIEDKNQESLRTDSGLIHYSLGERGVVRC